MLDAPLRTLTFSILFLSMECFSAGMMTVSKEGDIDKRTGELVIPCKWEFACSFSEGLAVVRFDNGKCGYIDKSGNEVIPCKWKYADCFSEGFALVQDDNGKYGYIVKDEKW